MTAQLNERVASALAGDPHQTAMEFDRADVPWGYLRDVAERIDALLTEAGFGIATPIGLVPRNRPAFAAALQGLLA